MTPSKPLVSIVIPAYNAAATLAECLAACRGQTYPNTETVVVDDGSKDETAAIAADGGARCIPQPNQGPAAARNRGVRETSGAFVAFTDSDCVPEPGWIDGLMAEFEEGVGAAGGPYGMANPERLLPRIIHEEIAARHQRLDGDVDFLGSFNVMYRRAAIESVGGFDETFRYASAEDNDLAYRLHDAGWRLRFSPHARVKHYHPERLLPYLRTQRRHGFWRMKLYAKHPNRQHGDRYAGLADLLRPPLLAGLVLAGGIGMGLAAIGAAGAEETLALAALALAVYLLLPLIQTGRLVARTGAASMAVLFPVGILRDGARALGLAHGVYHFRVRGRETG